MKVIFGLGNPGKKYEITRHNIGFIALDALASDAGVAFKEKKKYDALVAETFIGTEKVLLVKPQTFMNLSGKTVASVLKANEVDICDILVIYDDIDLDLGRMRFRAKGSSGGHNGIKSIFEHIGKENEFPRLKVGIGRDNRYKVHDYVLGRFSKEECKVLSEVVPEVVLAAEFFIKNDIEKTMNKYNN